jgi:hypothetical protein
MYKGAFGCMIISILLLVVALYLARKIKKEGYENLKLVELLPGTYPKTDDLPILDDYPYTGSKDVSNANSSQIWKDYPIFPAGDYRQITNNLRYWKNPDNGLCSRADFCNALYKDIKTKSNYVYPLPPAEEGDGARVGYFRSKPNILYWSIPDNENILY